MWSSVVRNSALESSVELEEVEVGGRHLCVQERPEANTSYTTAFSPFLQIVQLFITSVCTVQETKSKYYNFLS